jgi:transcription antitermination factor NusG
MKMKKIFLIFSVVLTALNCAAQTDSLKNKMTPPDFDSITVDSLNYNFKKESINSKITPYKDSIVRDVNTNKGDTNLHSYNKAHQNGTTMRGGKMVQIKDGRFIDMKEDITLADGIKILQNGTIVKKDGTKIKLEEGDFIDINGKHMPVKISK